jgi:hypothetical protein
MLRGPHARAIAASYRANLEFYRADPAGFFEQLHRYLTRARPAHFRFHVSGDFPDPEYFRASLNTARAFPETGFLAFTKRANFLPRGRARATVPENFTLIQSMWPNWTNGNGRAVPGYGRAYMLDPTRPDPRIPRNALRCPGNCETCNACWNIDAITARAVVFPRH